MSRRVLTIDLGNSRCKLVLWDLPSDARPRAVDERDLPTPQLLAEGHFEEVLGRWLDHDPAGLDHEPASASAHAAAPERVGLASVAAAAVERDLVDVLAARFGERLVRAPESGLVNECRTPDRVGRDRLFAARGAWELVRGAAIVVDAGTALTVDALAPGENGPRFLGGSIAPGPRLLADALARHAARLPLIEPQAGATALGRDTNGALQSGVVVGFRGAAAALAREVARESGLEAAPIVVTGGARAFLLEPRACFEGRVIEERLLVHQGLLAALDVRTGAR